MNYQTGLNRAQVEVISVGLSLLSVASLCFAVLINVVK